MNKNPGLEIQISGRKIERKYPPFILAELSGNPDQSLEQALVIVEAAEAFLRAVISCANTG